MLMNNKQQLGGAWMWSQPHHSDQRVEAYSGTFSDFHNCSIIGISQVEDNLSCVIAIFTSDSDIEAVLVSFLSVQLVPVRDNQVGSVGGEREMAAVRTLSCLLAICGDCCL